MQKTFTPCITTSLIHLCSSFVVPPSPNLQALLPHCPLYKKISLQKSCNSTRVFTCSIRIYLHYSEKFSPNYLQNHRNSLQAPSPFFFYLQNIPLNIYVYILKNTKRDFKTPKISNTYEMHYAFL